MSDDEDIDDIIITQTDALSEHEYDASEVEIEEAIGDLALEGEELDLKDIKEDEEKEKEDIIDTAESATVPEDEVTEIEEKGGIIEKQIVPPELRMTSNIMTNYELAAIIAARIEELSSGATSNIAGTELLTNEEIAYKELYERESAQIIIREVMPNVVEIWQVNEMAIPSYDRSAFK
jgi:DNA-directed RNA polymerase subunit K/omega